MNETGPPGRPFPFPGQLNPFNCTAALPSYPTTDIRNITEIPIALCPYDYYFGKQPPEINFDGDGWWAWLVLKTLGSYDDWMRTTMLENLDNKSDDEWLGFRSARSDAGLDVSLCFTNFDEIEAPITAWREHNFTELDLGWISSSRKYNTTEGFFQRGDDWNNYQVLDTAIGLTPFNRSYFMCTHCEHNYGDETVITDVNPALTDIFNDLIVHSDRPALAVQAIFTILCSMSIYDFLPSFNFPAPATYAIKIEASLPTKWVGFILVLIIITIHCLFTIATVLTFVVVAKESLLGNSWFAVGQVGKLWETESSLQGMQMATDKEIRRKMKWKGDDNVPVGVGLGSAATVVELKRQ